MLLLPPCVGCKAWHSFGLTLDGIDYRFQTKQEKGKRAAGAIVYTPGIEPTPSGTRPPCTSSILRYRCGNITKIQPTTLQWKIHIAGGSGLALPVDQEQQLFFFYELAGAVASTVRDGPRAAKTERTAGRGPRALSGMLVP